MASIKLKHSGGNGVIIAAPTSNPASDKTLTLPSDVDGTVVSKDSSNSLQNIAGINGGQLGNRRLTINGAMEVSQRGTSTTTNGYLIDRFTSSLGGIDQMQFTMSQSTDAPSGFRKSLKFDITTAETGGTGSDEYAMVRYITESQDIAHFLYGTSGAKTITLSFHVKAYQTGTYALNLFVGDSGRSYTANYTISQSATWEKKTLTFVGDTGGSEVNVDNGHGLYINWFMASGTDYKSSNAHFNQWGTLGSATGWAYGHNVDLLNSTDNYFQLAGVQLEVGSVATDFEHKSFAQELQLCRRYYILWIEGDQKFVCFGDHYSATQVDGGVQLPVEMRTTPTIDANTGGNYYIVYSAGGSCHIDGSLTSYKTNKNAVLWYATGDSSRTPGHANRWISDNASAKIAFSAEL